MEKYYNHIESEDKLKKAWLESSVYKFDKDSKKPLFNIDTPPPTVSGSLHIGHIFSYTQTDIIARFKRMSGSNVYYPFGFDDNGLPTERYVEKKLNVTGYNLGRSKFIELCLKESHSVEETFKDLWQKMGLSVDWNYTYSTISPETRKLSQESFIKLFEKGFVYKKFEPALYCSTCYTSVAQAELDDQDVPSKFNDIVFKLMDGSELLIGTTRPELLASCVAIFYHPDDTRYVHLKNKRAIVPVYGFEVEILPDESVLPEKGTGLVMCCTFGDKKDVEWCKKYNLPYKESIARDGKFTSITGPLEGLRVKAAREKILELLKEQDLLRGQKDINHSVNIHERCKKEIEIISIAQWFVKIIEFKDKFIELADQINWYPEHMKYRYVNWVENLSWDWCISRQRFYGIPFPVWYCADCKETIIADIKDLPIDPQESKPQNCKCGSTNLIPDSDVMDTWNTSSITPFICASLIDKNKNIFEDFEPMAMRPQAHDIIRTWAFDTIVKSWMHSSKIPWKDIVISGHVLAGGSEKISKSAGNSPFEPKNLMAQHSADAIRYWTSSANLGQDVIFSDTQLKQGGKLINKLWNAFKFLKEHVDKNVQRPSSLGVLNEWILNELQDTFDNYSNYLNKHEFHLALIELDKFFWASFCDNYLELIKHSLFNSDAYSKDELDATRWTLNKVGFNLLQLYAPYMPFITEELFTLIYKNDVDALSIHTTEFDINGYRFEDSKNIMLRAILVVEKIRKLKTENKLSLVAEVEEVIINTNSPHDFDKIVKIISGATKAFKITFANKVGVADSLENIDGKIKITLSL